MRLGAWLVAFVGVMAAAPGCSGEYPLAPTACDEWCHATKGEQCPDYYNPASCVSQCEERGDVESCRKELDAEIACFRNNPGASEERCGGYVWSMLPCAAEVSNLAACLAPAIDSSGHL